ncbi:uncharacterized protein BXZ73DRAFT_97969 [Epithele typhae]|uniref:uncharacterized protein n=1 Tax=Epithele typhae TaxID=378194 RepID=UPI0020087012|nr:uncharacterized protein BXZ73DRAFT_97969 [Epithele typhae]KAH9941580.1 hypothetical protein BXZ73DRAFT_97969 [Epithele typhae]
MNWRLKRLYRAPGVAGSPTTHAASSSPPTTPPHSIPRVSPQPKNGETPFPSKQASLLSEAPRIHSHSHRHPQTIHQRSQTPRQKIKKAKEQKDDRAIRRAKRIAAETQDIVLGDGQTVVSNRPTPSHRVAHNISLAVLQSRQRTVFYPHYSPTLARWQDAHQDASSSSTQIEFVDGSTLNTARSVVLPRLGDPMAFTDVGVLSFASPKRAGGSFLHGGAEQEDSFTKNIGRFATKTAVVFMTTLWFTPQVSSYSARTPTTSHRLVALVAPPPANVDPIGGKFIAPYNVNVLSVVPVNAAAVRAKHIIEPGQEQVFEDGIRHAMKERMARALRAFESHGDKVIVLGAFGCGSSENKVDMVAGIWAELLVCGETVGNVAKAARFKNSFDRVVFAVPGRLFQPFKAAFQLRLDEEILNVATLTI